MSFDAGSIEASLTLDRTPFNQGLALAKRAAASFGGSRYEATVAEKGAAGTAASVERVRRASDSLNGRNATVEVNERGVAGTLGGLAAVKRAAASLNGTPATVDVDKGGRARSALEGLVGGVNATRVAVGSLVVGFPTLIAAVGGLVPVALAAAGRTAQLALGIGQGLAGAVAVGGTAVAGAAVGLAGYAAVVGSVVTASRESYFALNKDAEKHLQHARAVILNTGASVRFNRGLNRMTLALSGVQAEVGRRVLPTFTRWMNLLQARLPQLTPPLYRMVGGVTRVADSFVVAISRGERFGRLKNVLDFVASSAVNGARVARNLGLALLAAIQPVLPLSASLQKRVVALTASLRRWAESAAGQRQLAAFFAAAASRAGQLYRIVVNVGKGLYGLFSALSANGGVGGAMRGLEDLTARWRSFMSATGRGRAAVRGFMADARPILVALGRLFGTVVREVLSLGGALARSRSGAKNLNTVAQAINGISRAVHPMRMLVQETFRSMGPLIGPVVVEVAKLARTFAGSSGALVTLVKRMTWLMRQFNSLPGPVKTVVANLVAFSTISKVLGLTTLVRLAASLVGAAAGLRNTGNSAVASRAKLLLFGNTTGKLGLVGMTGQLARAGAAFVATGAKALAARARLVVFGAATRALGLVTMIGSLARAGAAFVAMGAKALIAKAALVASRVATVAVSAATKAYAAAQWLLNAAMTANPIGLVVAALAALAAGIVYAYRNSETFRNGVKWLWGELKIAWDWIRSVAGALGGALLDGVSAAKATLNDLIGVFGNFSGIDLYEVGRGIVRGLGNGIGSMANFIRAAATKLAGSVVTAIRKRLGIRSPSREAAWAGTMSGKGLIEGLLSQEKSVHDAARKLADAARRGVRGTLGAPSVDVPGLRPAAAGRSLGRPPRTAPAAYGGRGAYGTYAPQVTVHVDARGATPETAREIGPEIERAVRKALRNLEDRGRGMGATERQVF